MTSREQIDVSGLPRFTFGPRGMMWWGVTSFLAIESTMLGICLVSYYYLRDRSFEWPLAPTMLPDLLVPTIGMALLLLSVAPMRWTESVARKLDTKAVIRGHVLCVVLGILIIAVRALELTRLNVGWDTNAYGSIVWTIIGIHTYHLLAEVAETAVIGLLFARGHTDPKVFVDATDNALYWYFIVLVWVPCYVTLYLVPRLG
ncbi:MAG TPA: cytochrome c oxidase subunit 3 [Candidatus Limnocylindrales bacterium]|nr:cytochrome c oxidase subunit 3 [Candidatus Limnocylindrales bacterium]